MVHHKLIINQKQITMKKQFLSFALVAAMIGAIATSCSSEKKAGDGSDSTKMDSTSQSAPAATDTAKTDTSKKDTTKH
ncbi:hypothetical protein SAMN03159284_01082 [Mucilaginibacter sp. NFR10]|nr:hypothetical protein GCM10011500_06660 [Mucilaginibacter rubeus]SCW47212.1 hypothetical protein SAMN03159284_01082 [Mucilaginibacter sp. NFR10]